MFGLNPWMILGVVLAIGAAGAGGFYEGHTMGVDQQKVADQVAIDRVNAGLTAQKAEAGRQLAAAYERNINLTVDRDKLKTKLEGEHVANQKATDDLRVRFAADSLRFRAEVSGSGVGGDGTTVTTGNTAGASPAAFIQLPDALARDIRQLQFEADQLADDYRLCYGYANQVK